MNKYEAMFIVKPTLSEDERKELFTQLADAVTKNNGSVEKAALWAERRKLWFPLRKFSEGVYYLVNFTADGTAVAKLRQTYKLNENVLRVLITVQK